jgi:hypothetical protein
MHRRGFRSIILADPAAGVVSKARRIDGLMVDCGETCAPGAAVPEFRPWQHCGKWLCVPGTRPVICVSE